MGRAPCCSKVGLHRGPWTATEDALLVKYIQAHGHGQWRSLPIKAGLLRCGKSCRLRWMNYLRPDIKRGNITREEDDLIIRLHSLLGNRWSLIAGRLPGRTDNEIKNYWNTHLSKRLRSHGTDPNTHKTLSHVDQAKQFKKSSKKRPGGCSSINKLGKMHKNINNNSNNNNEVDKRKGVSMEDSNNTNVERERSKVHLPTKPAVRVTSLISLASNNHSNGRSNNIATSFNSSTQNNLAFDQSLDIPWLPVPNNDNLMMMGACGADVDLDSIQNHHYYYYYYHNHTPDHKNQQLEKLYEEYLKLIEADDDHNRSNDSDLYYNNNDGDVAPLDTFTQSFLL